MIASLPLLGWPPGGALTILTFHRVLARPDPLRTGEVVADVFDAQMSFLRRYFAVLPIREAVALLQGGRLPRRACCITFDDGYADNLTVAAPILKAHGLPATVFVASGYLDGGRMFSESVIDAVALSPHRLLDLTELELGIHSLESVAERRSAIASILRRFRYRPPETRDQELPRLLELAGCGPLPADMMLTSNQVRALAESGFEIGGHTVTHPVLTSVDDGRAMDEVAAGKRRLEEVVGRPVRVFAYPNGKPGRDFATRHVAMVRDAGFEVAVTTARGVGRRHSDPLQLPRMAPWGGAAGWWAAQLTRNAWTGKAGQTC